jgi:hypothetical protein
MCLDCEIVQDLYVLYQENELSPNVKAKVEEHLTTCTSCRALYEEGKGFSNPIITDTETIAAPASLDDKIKLKLKLRKMRIAFVFVASILILYSYFNYIDSRKWLVHELTVSVKTVNQFRFAIADAKSEYQFDQPISSKIMTLSESNGRINRYLNPLEKRSLEKTTGTQHLDFGLHEFIFLLNQRYMNGLWTDQDELAYETMYELFMEYLSLLENTRNEFQMLFSQVDVAKIVELHDSINELSYTYTRFNKLPEEVDVLTTDQIEKLLGEYFEFNDENMEITFMDYANRTPKSKGSYQVQIRSKGSGSSNFSATIDAYNGQLIELNNISNLALTGELLPEEEVRESLQKLLKLQYGETVDLQIQFLGSNYNFTSNVDHQMYSYRVIPVYQGYELKQALLFQLDARTGAISSMFPESGGSVIDPKLLSPRYEVIFSKEEGLRQLKVEDDEIYRYQSTKIINSLLTGDYQLVHVYVDQYDRTGYINAKTGIEEIVLYQ